MEFVYPSIRRPIQIQRLSALCTRHTVLRVCHTTVRNFNDQVCIDVTGITRVYSGVLRVRRTSRGTSTVPGLEKLYSIKLQYNSISTN